MKYLRMFFGDLGKTAAVLAAIFALASVPSDATTVTIPYTFFPNTPALSGQVNANFTALAAWANGNVDNTNIGSAGIYASQICPTAAACNSTQTTFGGSALFTFPAGIAVAASGPQLTSGSGAPVAVLPEGSLYLRTDSGQTYSTTGGGVWNLLITSITAPATALGGIYSGFTSSGLPGAVAASAEFGMGTDGVGNAYYVAYDNTNSKIFLAKCTLSTSTGVACGTTNSLTDADFSANSQPLSVVADASHLWVTTNAGTGTQNKIKQYNVSTLALVNSFSITGTGGSTCQPESLVVNTSDSNNVYFNCNTGAVSYLFKMTTAGTFSSLVALAASGVYNVVEQPASSNLWVMKDGTGNIYKYDNTGTLLNTYNSGNISGLCASCQGLQFDGTPNPWTSSFSTTTVSFYKLAGTSPGSATTYTQTVFTTPASPQLYIAADGFVYYNVNPSLATVANCIYSVTTLGVLNSVFCPPQNVGANLGVTETAGVTGINPPVASIAGMVAWGTSLVSHSTLNGIAWWGAMGASSGTATKYVRAFSAGVFPGTVVTLPGTTFGAVNEYGCTGTAIGGFGTTGLSAYVDVDNVTATTVRVSTSQQSNVAIHCAGSF